MADRLSKIEKAGLHDRICAMVKGLVAPGVEQDAAYADLGQTVELPEIRILNMALQLPMTYEEWISSRNLKPKHLSEEDFQRFQKAWTENITKWVADTVASGDTKPFQTLAKLVDWRREGKDFRKLSLSKDLKLPGKRGHRYRSFDELRNYVERAVFDLLLESWSSGLRFNRQSLKSAILATGDVAGVKLTLSEGELSKIIKRFDLGPFVTQEKPGPKPGKKQVARHRKERYFPEMS